VAARLVIVQTDDELAGALCDVLAADGVEAIRADDGADAVRLVRTCEPVVVLVDLTLPPLDGWCVLAALGEWRERGSRPEIVVRVADHSQVERALRLGADAWAADDAQVVAAAGRLLTATAA
jgi:two-component system, OmpR family, KDP operon response regulator KdpE